MCCDRVVQISVKNDMASSVGPAAHIDCHANGGGMARRIFDMNAHNGIFSAHPLGPKANGIDSILQKLFHISRSLIFIVGTNGTLLQIQRFLLFSIFIFMQNSQSLVSSQYILHTAVNVFFHLLTSQSGISFFQCRIDLLVLLLGTPRVLLFCGI